MQTCFLLRQSCYIIDLQGKASQERKTICGRFDVVLQGLSCDLRVGKIVPVLDVGQKSAQKIDHLFGA
jgi:hypothetical protein